MYALGIQGRVPELSVTIFDISAGGIRSKSSVEILSVHVLFGQLGFLVWGSGSSVQVPGSKAMLNHLGFVFLIKVVGFCLARWS